MEKTKLKMTIQDGDYSKAILLPVDTKIETILSVIILLGFAVTVEAVKRDSE